MKKFLLAAAAALALCIGGDAQAQALGVSGWPNVSTVLNITSATTTKVLSGGSRQNNITYLGFSSGGAGAVTFEYGTGSNCGTNTVALSGGITVGANVYSLGDGVGALFTIPAGFDFCIITGTTATVVGTMASNQQSGL